MSWIDIAWPMMAAASLTLALVHLFLWLAQRRDRAYLLLSIAAAAVAVLAILELLLMHADNPGQYARILRWAQVFITLLLISFVSYVRLRFQAGAWWLATTVIVLRLLCLIPNFLTGVNLNFRSIDTLLRIEFLGSDPVSVPVGSINPWIALGYAANLILMAFLIHAIVQVWKRGHQEERRLAAIICGGIVVFLAIASVWGGAVYLGQLRAPRIINAPFFIIIVAMAYDLSWRLVRSARITEDLQSSQAQLRESEQRFRTVFEASPTALLMVDTEGHIVLANAQVESVFGYASDELIGMSIEALVPHRIRANHASDRARFSEAPQARGMGVGRDLRGLRRDGSEVPVVVGLRPISTPEGRFVLASVADISERLELERESALQREELAHLSRVGMLGELSGSMAHELNQPLAAILSNAQAAQRLMANDPIDLDEVRASLTDIIADDKRAGDVIRRLRAMLKKQATDSRVLDINELVLEILRLARSDLLNRNASARTLLAPGLALVKGDPVQLQQILINLLLNAGDAMLECEDPRELVIRSSATREGWVQIDFIDTGHGIPGEDLERIFEPFVTSKRDGLGLGLAVCRSIIQSHGGRLWAQNNPERGATLSFALPPYRDAPG